MVKSGMVEFRCSLGGVLFGAVWQWYCMVLRSIAMVPCCLVKLGVVSVQYCQVVLSFGKVRPC
jgi:hypothetical protein